MSIAYELPGLLIQRKAGHSGYDTDSLMTPIPMTPIPHDTVSSGDRAQGDSLV